MLRCDDHMENARWPAELEAQRELVFWTQIDQHPVLEEVTANEAVDALAV